MPVEVPQKKGDPIVIAHAMNRRAKTPRSKRSAKLRPAFKKDGTVTAGNAPGTNDGAAAVVVTSESNAARLGKTPMARIVAQVGSGVEPKWVMMAPVEAVDKLLQKTGWDRDKDVDSVRTERSLRRAGDRRDAPVAASIPPKSTSMAARWRIGHPIGASGARILVTLLYEMQRRNLKRGIAALCLGGGNAVALAVERY